MRLIRIWSSLAIALFGSACHSLPVLETDALGPIGRLDVSDGPHGMIATMGQGTTGTSVFELPSGDLLLVGQGETGFLLRLTPEGRARWTLQTCWEPNVAFAADDVIYASAPTFLDAGRVGEPMPVRGRLCGPRATRGARTSLVRLDGRGAVQWKRDTGLSDSVLSASADHVFVLGLPDPRTGPTKVMAFTPQGQVAWTWQGHAWSSSAAWSPAHQLLVAGAPRDDGSTVPQACVLTALDEATGKSVWEKTVVFSGSDGSTRLPCSVGQILVSPRGAILLVNRWTGSTYDYVIIGFDLSTGRERWRRSIDVTDFVPSANAPPTVLPGSPLLLETQGYRNFQAGVGRNPIIVALDPDTGREAPVAVLRGDLPENHDITPQSRLAVLGFAWGRENTVVVTGDFRGRVLAGDLRADSESTVETLCVDIDPGFGPTSLTDAQGRCKFASARMRLYGHTLFVARIPVIRPR